MAALDRPRHERFAQLLAEGMSDPVAYAKAGYRAGTDARYGNAYRLGRDPRIKSRVQELQAEAAKECKMTIEAHLEELNQLKEAAREKGDLSAAIRAEQLRGQVSGFYVERRENMNVNYDIVPDAMEPKDWESQYTSPGENGTH